MNRGYTLLWRKIWANPLLCEPGRKYSRLEEWLYVTNVLAAGKDDDAAGLKRGEFVASVRYLARCFGWSHGMARRFLDLLIESSMISRVVRKSVPPAVQEAGHFIVSYYVTYNQARYADMHGKRYGERYKIKEVVKEGFKEAERKDTHVPSADGVSVSPKALVEIDRQNNQALPRAHLPGTGRGTETRRVRQ